MYLCGCLTDPPKSPGLAFLADISQARPPTHPDLRRLCFGQLEIEGSFWVSLPFDFMLLGTWTCCSYNRYVTI